MTDAEKIAETIALCEETVKNIELDELPLDSIMLKASRIARLLGDDDAQQIFQFEASGYPTPDNSIPKEIWRLAELAGRVTPVKEAKSEESKEQAFTESISEIKATIDSETASLKACGSQLVMPRRGHATNIRTYTGRLASRRAYVHGYAVDQLAQLRFSKIAEDIFSRIRLQVDAEIAHKVPEAVRKFASIHENLASENPEDWSNSAHSCRRILQDLADTIFPAQEDRIKDGGGKIKLGVENYINRLVCFIDDHSESERYREVVGSQLSFIGDRLDALFRAAQKGSHATISTRIEAERYAVYTYMIVADILKLNDSIET